MSNKKNINGISIVIPVHNEASILEKEIKSLFSQAKRASIKISELILVENGSVDNSWQIIQRLAKKYTFIIPFQSSEQSYGQALKIGILAAQAPIIIIFNADLIDFSFVEKATHLLEVVDIVIASKTLAASDDQRTPTRKLTTYFFNVFLRLVLNYPGTDTHGIKAFKNTFLLKETLKKCLTRNELLDTELVIRLTRSKALLVELPIIVKEIRPTRYLLHTRIYLVAKDFTAALKSKYFSDFFESDITVADDYGISNHVNRAIITIIQKKEVQVASVLITHVDRQAIQELKKNLGKKNWSLHFNLLRNKPISVTSTNSLVDKNGNFFSIGFFFWKLFWKQINLDEIKIELQAQHQAMVKAGIMPTYLDSEQHTHTFSPIAHIVSQFAEEKKLLIRSRASTRYYLKRKKFRFIIFKLMNWLLNWRYPSTADLLPEYDAYICHPGTSYD